MILDNFSSVFPQFLIFQRITKISSIMACVKPQIAKLDIIIRYIHFLWAENGHSEYFYMQCSWVNSVSPYPTWWLILCALSEFGQCFQNIYKMQASCIEIGTAYLYCSVLFYLVLISTSIKSSLYLYFSVFFLENRDQNIKHTSYCVGTILGYP